MPFQFYETHPQGEHAWVGAYNDLPPNFERITQAEFWKKFDGGYVPLFRTDKWVVSVARVHPLYAKHIHMFVYDDKTAVGYVSKTEHAAPVKPDIYFKAALCHHEMREVSSRGFLHTYQCTKCPYNYTVDSSG